MALLCHRLMSLMTLVGTLPRRRAMAPPAWRAQAEMCWGSRPHLETTCLTERRSSVVRAEAERRHH
eukprot:14221858-Ditylum_brightwellii.AAC.1